MKFLRLSLASALFAAGVLGSTPVVADTANVDVSAQIVGTCKFETGVKSVSFVLDQTSSGDATATVSQPKFWCTKGTTYSLSDNNGKNFANSKRRMSNGTDYIPYSFTYTLNGTGTGKGSPITMDIASTVANADFINVPAGTYTDTVQLTITP